MNYIEKMCLHNIKCYILCQYMLSEIDKMKLVLLCALIFFVGLYFSAMIFNTGQPFMGILLFVGVLVGIIMLILRSGE